MDAAQPLLHARNEPSRQGGGKRNDDLEQVHSWLGFGRRPQVSAPSRRLIRTFRVLEQQVNSGQEGCHNIDRA
jgi:hypothetical protein